MKGKYLIGLGIFALGLSAGAFASAVAKQAPTNILETKADASRVVYLDIGNSGWGSKLGDGVNIYVHYWGGTEKAGTTWPGVILEKVDTDLTGLYSVDVGDSTNLAFSVNVAGGSWGGDCQTVDISLEEGKNLYTINGKVDEGGDINKKTGTWSVKPEDNTVYVLDKYGDLLNNSAKIHLYRSDKTGPYTSYPGKTMAQVGEYNIYSATYYGNLNTANINQKGDGDKTGQTLDLALVPGKCLYLTHDTTDFKWNSTTWISLEAAEYIDEYLHFADFDEADQTQGTACLGDTGYYKKAADAYELLSPAAKTDVGDIAEVAARLSAWAQANNKTFDAETGFAIMSVEGIKNEQTASSIIIISLAAVAAVGFVSFVALRRKKINL